MKLIKRLLAAIGLRWWVTLDTWEVPQFTFGHHYAGKLFHREQVCAISGKKRRQSRNGYGWKTNKGHKP